jgi:hypothetical protein
MSAEKKEFENNDEPVTEVPKTIPKVSKIIIDEKTGTITLKIASEEEIAEAMKNEQLSINNEGSTKADR